MAIEDYSAYDTDKLDRKSLTDNIDFMNDAAEFLADRENYFTDNSDDLYDRYLEHFRYQNVNEVSAMRDLYLAQNYEKSGDQEGLNRMNRLMSTFEKQDGEYNLETVTDYLGGVMTAPSTIASTFSFGAAKAGAVAAQQGIKFGIKQIIKEGAKAKGRTHVSKKALDKGTEELGKLATAKNAFIGGGYRTAIGSGVVEGGGAFATAAAQETTRVATGQKDEEDFSYGNIGLATALGAGFGTVLGGGIGTRKALTSNVTESILVKEQAKKATLAKKAFRDHTVKTYANKGNAGKFARDTEAKLRLSLKETAGKQLEKGAVVKKKLKGKNQENLAVTLEDTVIQNIASAAATIIDKVGVRGITKEEAEVGIKIFKEKGKTAKGAMNPKDFDKNGKIIKGSALDLQERITSRVGRGLTDQTKLTNEMFGTILKQHGLDASEFSSLYVSDVSAAGRTLGTAGRISSEIKAQLFNELDELDKGLMTLGTATDSARKKSNEILDKSFEKYGLNINFNGVSDFVRSLNKSRIGLMTIQTATTVRNTTNGYMRNYVYALDNIGQGTAKMAYGALLRLGSSDEGVKQVAKEAVKAGVGQFKATALQSIFLKDMIGGLNSQETAMLVKLFQDPKLGKSDLAKQLFREMGDIGVSGNDNGIMVGTARWLNGLNTMSDNLFKKAVFSREIDKVIRTDATDIFKIYKKDGTLDKEKSILSLEDLLIRDKKMTMLDDKIISTAMEKALDFTYQTGKFAGKEGQFNLFADFFIKMASSTIGSTFVPFPRYLVNQFRFFYEHMPILGMIDHKSIPIFGGILNKSDMTERIGKQFTGLSMLGAFYGMRAHFGDENTGAYEYKNPYGHGTFDARASLGPFTAYAWMADMLYTNGGPKGLGLHDNDKVVPSLNTRELSEAFTGGFGRAGTGLSFVDSIAKIAVAESNDGKLPEKIQQGLVKMLANYMSTYTVGAGVLKDIGAAVYPEYRLLADNADVEFIPYFLKQSTRSFPFETNADGEGFFTRPAQTTSTRTTGISNVMPLFRQFTGLTPAAEKNDVEKEFARLNMDYYEYTPRKTTDADINREARQRLAFLYKEKLEDFINRPPYTNYKTNTQKRHAIKKVVGSLKTQARNDAMGFNEEFDTEEDVAKKAKAIFFNLPESSRGMIMEEWEARNPGEEFDEDQPYMELLELNEDLKKFDFTTGGKKKKYQNKLR